MSGGGGRGGGERRVSFQGLYAIDGSLRESVSVCVRESEIQMTDIN